jgi:hypothetical protein
MSDARASLDQKSQFKVKSDQKFEYIKSWLRNAFRESTFDCYVSDQVSYHSGFGSRALHASTISNARRQQPRIDTASRRGFNRMRDDGVGATTLTGEDWPQ